jgi:integrase/recombinase XerD
MAAGRSRRTGSSSSSVDDIRRATLAPPSSGARDLASSASLNSTLKKDGPVDMIILAQKRPKTLPVVLSPEEVVQFLEYVKTPKHRTLLTTCYAAGLRISEATHLTVSAINSRRLVLQVEQGKGQQDRYVMLSPKLLEILRTWWRVLRPPHWLFPGDQPDRPISGAAVAKVCKKAHRRSRIAKPITPHALRHAFAAHLLETSTDVRTIQLLLDHRSLATTARYLRIATIKVCATTSPFDWLPRPDPPAPPPLPPAPPPQHF